MRSEQQGQQRADEKRRRETIDKTAAGPGKERSAGSRALETVVQPAMAMAMAASHDPGEQPAQAAKPAARR